MAGYEAVFLKIKEHPNKQFLEDIVALLRSNNIGFREQIVFRYHKNYPWIQIQELPWIEHLLDGRDKSCNPKFAQLLSKHFSADVICLYTQTVVDAVGYWHFQDGTEVRCLVYGFYQERIWEEVRGVAEDWETNVFFNLETYADDLLEDENFAERIIQLHQTKQLQVGSEIPFFSSRDVRQIAEHFNLPGFSQPLDWNVEKKI